VTDSPLPDSGPEREIFLHALRLFSNECEPPNLIAECPFSIDLPSGGRGCGEECLELLSSYGVSRSAGGVALGNSEVTAHSMGRPKRPTSYVGSAKPFDAAEFFYRDSDDPDRSNWETISLLFSLKSTYLPRPEALLDPDRSEKLAATTAELRRRGFDVDELLCYGLRLQLAYALSLAIVMPDLLAAQPPQTGGESESAQAPGLLAQSPAGWPELLDKYLLAEGYQGQHAPPPDASKLRIARHRLNAVMTGSFRTRLRIWAATAPVDDLTNWRPPTIDEFLAYDLATESVIRAKGRRPRWLIDRFTEAYLKDWNIYSLQLEWRYQQGAEKSPCAQREMTARFIDVNALARALAEATANPVSDTLPAIQSTVVRLLLDGRRSTAAAVLDAARQDHWDNPYLQNDYGFCLLPDDPAEALKAFELAASLGSSRTVNICNRVLALFRLGRNAAALELADQAIEHWNDLDHTPAYLWDFTTSEPKLLTRACPRCYLLALATRVADTSGNELVAARWRDRQSRLPHDSAH
jgi:hypothetical protein